MGRAPKISYQDELAKLKARERELRERQIAELGKLVISTGAADALHTNAIAGALLLAIEEVQQEPASGARYAERGAAFFQKKPRASGGTGQDRKGADAGASDAE